MTIFVSTGGERQASALDIAEHWSLQGIKNIELSGGAHDPHFEERLLRFADNDVSITLHNYLPLRREAFVLNLASPDRDIFAKSKHHIEECIDLSAKIGADHYAVHAGFLLDPVPKELGRPLRKVALYNRREAEDRFISAIRELGDYAHSRDVRLLIENNVYSSSNRRIYPSNPLLMTDPASISEILERCEGSAGLLLDVAHLKVSSVSQAFDLRAAIFSLQNIVEGLHLSDNDGFEDQNAACREDSWFWGLLPKVKYSVLEVYGLDACKIKNQVELASVRL